MDKRVEDKLEDIISLCKKHRVEYLSIFGSAAQDSMRDSSDIDFLVQFSDDLAVLDYADNYFALLESLESLLGKRIDLVSRKSLKNPVLVHEIESSKIDLYAA